MRRRTRIAALVAGAGVALGSGTVLLAGTAAWAEPNPCAGSRSDGGTGGTENRNDPLSGAKLNYIYGNWYNCSGGSAADHVKINVGHGWDGPCITVAYGTSGFSGFEQGYLYIPPYYNGWKRC